jgi:hypothetical protein
MLNTLRIAIAGMLIMSAATMATAQVRGGSTPPRPQAAPPSTGNPYGLSNCSERPFARECDRRGMW